MINDILQHLEESLQVVQVKEFSTNQKKLEGFKQKHNKYDQNRNTSKFDFNKSDAYRFEYPDVDSYGLVVFTTETKATYMFYSGVKVKASMYQVSGIDKQDILKKCKVKFDHLAAELKKDVERKESNRLLSKQHTVKVGDVFVQQVGRFVEFFQVVDLIGTQSVSVREVESTKTRLSDITGVQKLSPIIDSFTKDSKAITTRIKINGQHTEITIDGYRAVLYDASRTYKFDPYWQD